MADQDSPTRTLIFENERRQAVAYRELFEARGHLAETALPSQDVQAVCERLQPDVVIFDMAFWESDTAAVFGIINQAQGFPRPVIVALCVLPHQVRRARKFGADAQWIRGVDDAADLPRLAEDLVRMRREGTLKARVPTTPL